MSLHCYHSYAVQDRINIHGLSDETPDLRSTPLLSIPVNTVLPSQTDESNILHNITILVSRELVQHLKYFEDNFSDVTVKHIKHDYYEEMCQKSNNYSMYYYTHII